MNKKNFKLKKENMLISQTECYFENPENSKKERFRMLTQKPTMELKELNGFCKHTKNVRNSQPCISMNFCTKFSKAQVLPCEYH